MTATILMVDDEPDLEALVLQGVIGGECFALATDQRGRVVPGRRPDAVSRTTASGRLGVLPCRLWLLSRSYLRRHRHRSARRN